MSTEIAWVLEVEIVPGQADNFRAVAADLIASSRTEPGTLAYEWYINEAGTVCHIYERYRDPIAVLTHVERFGRFAERFLQACRPVRFSVYGTPDGEVQAALADFQPVYYSLHDGFNR